MSVKRSVGTGRRTQVYSIQERGKLGFAGDNIQGEGGEGGIGLSGFAAEGGSARKHAVGCSAICLFSILQSADLDCQ